MTSEKQRQQAAELCGASVRALTGLRELRNRGRSLFLGGRRVQTGAPHSSPDPARDGFSAERGAADGIALRLLHSDAALHRDLAPKVPIQRLIFDLLEQLRVETLVSSAHRGMRNNLRRDDEMELALDICTFGGAAIMEVEAYGLDIGCRADCLLVEGETLAEAIVTHAPRKLVLKSGEVIARDGACVIEAP